MHRIHKILDEQKHRHKEHHSKLYWFAITAYILCFVFIVVMIWLLINAINQLNKAQQEVFVKNQKQDVTEVIKPTVDTSNWLTYTNNKYGYTVQYPPTVKVLVPDNSDTSPIFFFPEDENYNHLGYANLDLSIYFRNGTLEDQKDFELGEVFTDDGELDASKMKVIDINNATGIKVLRNENDLTFPLNYVLYPNYKKEPVLRLMIRNLYGVGNMSSDLRNKDSKINTLKQIAATFKFSERL